MTTTCLRDVTALDVPLHDVPLPFREAICTLFPVYIASCSETLILPNCGVQFWRGALQLSVAATKLLAQWIRRVKNHGKRSRLS